MENNNEIFRELTQVSPRLSVLKNKVPYAILPTYFDQLPEIITEKVKMATELSHSSTKRNPYSAPAGYFENFFIEVIRKLNAESSKNEVFEEMENISPLINTINKNPVFKVPEEYFKKIEYNNVQKIAAKPKIAYFTTGSNVFKYAAAAIIIGVLAVGIFLFTGKDDVNVDTALSKVKAKSAVKKLSEQEIVDFLKYNSPNENIVTNNKNSRNKSTSKDRDIKKMVSEMSETEIKQFLKENGEEVEM